VTKPLLVAVIVALTLVACSGDDEVGSTTEASESAVERYASLVIGHESDWRERVAHIHDTCADAHAANHCAAAYQKAGELADTFHTALRAAQDPDCQADAECSEYVGEAPAAIATLVAETESAAAEYGVAFEAWAATGCANPLDWHCGADEGLAMSKALGDLTRQFDAWKSHID
jgi:hypothetical protein